MKTLWLNFSPPLQRWNKYGDQLMLRPVCHSTHGDMSTFARSRAYALQSLLLPCGVQWSFATPANLQLEEHLLWLRDAWWQNCSAFPSHQQLQTCTHWVYPAEKLAKLLTDHIWKNIHMFKSTKKQVLRFSEVTKNVS